MEPEVSPEEGPAQRCKYPQLQEFWRARGGQIPARSPAYILALPFAILRGHAYFMDLVVRLFDHLGKLFAVVGINPIKEHYVVE